MNTKLSQFEDVETLKKVLVRDREALDAAATVDRYVQHLGQRDFKAYFDEPMEALAIVLPPQEASSMAQLATFTITRAGWLTNVADNVFAAILRDNPKLVWTVKSDDENLTCQYMSWGLEKTFLSQKKSGQIMLISQILGFFDKAEGSLSRNGEVLFWTGRSSSSPFTTRALKSSYT